MKNIHASCIELDNKGILFLGKSGAGKSDLALRMIEELHAILISDDRTDLLTQDKKLIASCPDNIKGLLEVRGIGILKFPYKKITEVKLVVELQDENTKIERLPKDTFFCFDDIKIKKIYVHPFEASAIYKIRLACDEKLQAY